MPPTKLKGLNALVTGAHGFIGQALCTYLVEAGANVTGLDLEKSALRHSPAVKYFQVDILDFEQLDDVLKALGLTEAVVFHLAGQSNVGKSRSEPLSTWSVNVTGTAHVLEACRRVDIRKIIFPSTALVYARPARLPLTEADPAVVDSVYASTKLASEALVKSYAVDFGFTCRIARLGNVYGPGASDDSVVKIILRQVRDRGAVTLKTVSSSRDFVYRDDVASGLAALAVRMDEPGSEIFNLSSGVPTSIRQLVELACFIEGIEPQIIETQPTPPGGRDEIWVSIKRLTEYTGWHPAWTLEQGLRQTMSEMESVTNDQT